MADSVSISIAAETSGLNAAVEQSRAQLRALQQSVQSLARRRRRPRSAASASISARRLR